RLPVDREFRNRSFQHKRFASRWQTDRFSCRRFKRFSQSKYGRLPIDLPVRFAKRVVRDDAPDINGKR
ncbi:MAG: hypothetical protein ACLVHC_12035, partial [Eggerthella lenta]